MVQELQKINCLGKGSLLHSRKGEYQVFIGGRWRFVQSFPWGHTVGLLATKLWAGMNVGERRQLGISVWLPTEEWFRFAVDSGDIVAMKSLVIRSAWWGTNCGFGFWPVAGLVQEIGWSWALSFWGSRWLGKTLLTMHALAQERFCGPATSIEDPVEIGRICFSSSWMTRSAFIHDNLIKLSLRHRPTFIIGEIRDK